MNRLVLVLYSCILIFISCSNSVSKNESNDNEMKFNIENPSDLNWVDLVVTIDNEDFLKKINSNFGSNFEIISDDKSINFEMIPASTEFLVGRMLVQISIDAAQKRDFVVRKCAEPKQFPKLTHAELTIKRGGEWKKVTKKNGKEQFEYQGGDFVGVDSLLVPAEHTDHSFFIKYEGPGWESDKVAYRFYLDWRNAADVFGKKVSEPVLHKVGLDGFDSYHDPADWGMDVLKVGKSLGIGSIAYWDGQKAVRVEKTQQVICRIVRDGNLQSVIKTDYRGWSVADTTLDLFSTISIDAGSRLTRQDIVLSNDIENICTGFIRNDSVKILQSTDNSGEWAYMASFGKQSLNKDNLGLVVFYRNDDFLQKNEDKNSYIVVLKPQNRKLTYYFAAAWELEKNAVATEESFSKYLDQTIKLLNSKPIFNYSN